MLLHWSIKTFISFFCLHLFFFVTLGVYPRLVKVRAELTVSVPDYGYCLELLTVWHKDLLAPDCLIESLSRLILLSVHNKQVRVLALWIVKQFVYNYFCHFSPIRSYLTCCLWLIHQERIPFAKRANKLWAIMWKLDGATPCLGSITSRCSGN